MIFFPSYHSNDNAFSDIKRLLFSLLCFYNCYVFSWGVITFRSVSTWLFIIFIQDYNV